MEKITDKLELLKIEKKRTYNILTILLLISILFCVSYIVAHMYLEHRNYILLFPIFPALIVGINTLIKELRPHPHLILYLKITDEGKEDEELWRHLFFVFNFISFDEKNNVLAATPTSQTYNTILKLVNEELEGNL